MQILVQQTGTRLFLGKDGGWVEYKDLAQRFHSSAEALDYCTRHGIFGFDILLTFQDSIWDIRIPGIVGPKSRKPVAAHKAQD